MEEHQLFLHVKSVPALQSCEPAVVSVLLGRFKSSIKKWILIKILSTGDLADILRVCVCDKSLLFSAEIWDLA